MSNLKPKIHWLMFSSSTKPFCGQAGHYVATTTHANVSCDKCLDQMKLHGHLKENDQHVWVASWPDLSEVGPI